MQERTRLLIAFFKDQLRFTDYEIIYFTEAEVQTLIDLLDQSKIFKQFNRSLEPRLVAHARRLFMDKPSSPSQLLTIFLNESRHESIRDFVVNRNPEFALTIVYKYE